MIKKFVGSALFAACAALSTVASATPVTLTGSIANNTLLSNGTVSGVFDGTSVLPTDYTINSLTFSFTFLDDTDPLTSSTTVTGKTSTGYDAYSWLTYVRDVTTTQTVTQTGQQESVSLALAGVTVGSGATTATQTSSTTTSSGQLSLDSVYCFLACLTKYSDNITVTTTNTTDWTGSFTISGTVTDASILSQLLSNDQLLYSLTTSGDVYLTSAQLNLDITPTTQASSAVPEPSTILLALAGLGGIGLGRRYGKRARARA